MPTATGTTTSPRASRSRRQAKATARAVAESSNSAARSEPRATATRAPPAAPTAVHEIRFKSRRDGDQVAQLLEGRSADDPPRLQLVDRREGLPCPRVDDLLRR